MKSKLKEDDYLALAKVFAGAVMPFILSGQIESNQPYTFSCNFRANSDEFIFISTIKLIKENI